MKTAIKIIFNQKGFSAVEVMVSLLLFAIISVAIFSAYNTNQKSYFSGKEASDLQQNLRAVMDAVVLEVRSMGYNVSQSQDIFISAEEDYLEFFADVNRNLRSTVGGYPAEERKVYFESNIIKSRAANDSILTLGKNINELKFDYYNRNGVSLLDRGQIPPRVPDNSLDQISLIKITITAYTREDTQTLMTLTSKITPRNPSMSQLPFYARIDSVPPDPVSLSAEDLTTCGKVSLDWSSYNEAGQGDVFNYKIFCRDASFTNTSALTPTHTKPAGVFKDTITGLEDNTTYYFAVTAVDEALNENTSVNPTQENPTCADSLQISVSQPSEGDTLRATVVFQAQAIDPNSVIKSVTFYVDGANSYVDNFSPYRYNGDTGYLNSALYQDGSHKLSAYAKNQSGMVVASDSINVIIDNILCDYPPEITITSPQDQSTVEGQVFFTADASGHSGISNVKFYIDGEYIWTENYSPYYCYGDNNKWDTTQWDEGTHQLVATAKDPQDCTSSDTVTVNVDNIFTGIVFDSTYSPFTQGTYAQEVCFSLANNDHAVSCVINKMTFTWDKTNARLHAINCPLSTQVYSSGTSVANAKTSGTEITLDQSITFSPLQAKAFKLFFWHKDGDSNPGGGRENIPMNGATISVSVATSCGQAGPYTFYLSCTVGISNLTVSNGASTTPYEIAYLHESDRYYVDRTYYIQDIPAAYENLRWIKTANDDKNCGNSYRLRFTLDRAATVYVAYDSRGTPPNWVKNYFTNTGDVIDVSDTGTDVLRLWKLDVSSGQLDLGGNKASGWSGGVATNYVVLVKCR